MLKIPQLLFMIDMEESEAQTCIVIVKSNNNNNKKALLLRD